MASQYAPGTQLTVGSHKIKVIKYISQGGFATVYTCEVEPEFQGSSIACLKRVLVPSKWQLNLLRQEVDAMKRLRGNPTIVSYIDSHASRVESAAGPGAVNGAHAQQYEVLLLMEYCSNNGLIDFMNTRLTNKLTEPEILVIMRDIVLAVTMCHHLQPPLIHRDIKIENVLLDSKRTFKLCDFGSAVPFAPVPKNAQEMQALKDDIMQHTTPQYRAPEMIDLTRGFPIDDKLDIWALGCFLFKLCYYTTPFELQSHASLHDLEHLILNGAHTLRLPHNRPGSTFSPRLKNVIKCCLRDDPRRRPNGSQLLEEICSMMNLKPPSVIPYSVKFLDKNVERKILDHRVPKEASIDKSKLLIPPKQIARPKSLYGSLSPNLSNSSPALPTKPTRPKSIYGSRDALPASSNTLKTYIQSQLNQSSESISAPKDTDNDNNTLNFLKDMEEGLSSNNTGGSFKQSFKNGLRRISTGNSSVGVRSANNTGNSYVGNKRSSISSIKQLLTGGDRKVSSSDKEKQRDPPKKLSIQRRMAQYLTNGEAEVKRTAQGYGRFTTEESDTDDLEAINNDTYKAKKLQPPKVPVSLSSKYLGKSVSTTNMDTSKPLLVEKRLLAAATAAAKKPVKKPPPKPKKPQFLRTPESKINERRLSDSSEISLPDIDDLEKQFAKRFPSYV